MRTTLGLLLCLTLCVEASPAKPLTKRTAGERSVSVAGFRGRIGLKELPNDQVEITVRTAKYSTRDVVKGHELFSIQVNGRKQPFFIGKFGASKLPLLIFAVSDPDRLQDSRVISYQVTQNGALIGQQVIVDQATLHGHSDDQSGGRYQLAAVDPSLGAIYSVSYQDARFDGYFVSYEKLRIRQWDPAISGFIETDQGFLREKNGKLVESTRFHALDDRKREDLFVSNLRPFQDRLLMLRSPAKALPVSLRQASGR